MLKPLDSSSLHEAALLNLNPAVPVIAGQEQKVTRHLMTLDSNAADKLQLPGKCGCFSTKAVAKQCCSSILWVQCNATASHRVHGVVAQIALQLHARLCKGQPMQRLDVMQYDITRPHLTHGVNDLLLCGLAQALEALLHAQELLHQLHAHLHSESCC